MTDRKILRRGESEIHVVPEHVNHYIAQGYVEKASRRTPRKTRTKAGEK